MHNNQFKTGSHADIPASVKVFTWGLILAGLFFAYVFMFNPGMVFHGAQISDYSSQLGFYSTGVRVLGSVVALLISVVFNRADWLLITLISRLAIELGDIVVGFATGGAMANNAMVALIAVFELWAIVKLVRVQKL